MLFDSIQVLPESNRSSVWFNLLSLEWMGWLRLVTQALSVLIPSSLSDYRNKRRENGNKTTTSQSYGKKKEGKKKEILVYHNYPFRKFIAMDGWDDFRQNNCTVEELYHRLVSNLIRIQYRWASTEDRR